jgi:hypothetical protein
MQKKIIVGLAATVANWLVSAFVEARLLSAGCWALLAKIIADAAGVLAATVVIAVT